jgi:hypothetical protein
MKSQTNVTQIKKIKQQINQDIHTISQLKEMSQQLSLRISNNKKMLENICDHQWKITRDIYDDHSMKSCTICGIEIY